MNDEELECSEVGGTLAACTWTYSQAVKCNGQKEHGRFRGQKTNSVIEAVNWSCSNVLPNHVWVSEFSLVLHEQVIPKRMKFDMDVPCIVQ